MNVRSLLAIIFSMLIFFSWNSIEKKFFPKVYSYRKTQLRKKNREKNFSKKDRSVLFSKMQKKEPSLLSSQKPYLIKKREVDLIKIGSKEMFLSVSPFAGTLTDLDLKNTSLLKDENLFVFLGENHQIWNDCFYSVLEKNERFLLLQYETPEKLFIQKSYKIIDDYTFEFQLNFINKNSKSYRFSDGCCLSGIKSLGSLKNWKREKRYFKISIFNDADKKMKNYHKVKRHTIVYDSPYWIAWQNKYFALIVKPFGKISRVYLDKASPFPYVSIRSFQFSLKPEEKYSEKFLIYCGPKNRKFLKKKGHYFEKVVSFGFFNKISLGLLFILNFFYSLFGNYGVAIILLTILVKMLLFPLSQKSLKSMKKLQKIQPHVDGLRKKYRDDPKKLQMEMTKMYRNQKINPVGGCLPVLAQMPFFLALFWLLQSAYELKGAPFLWVTDLSVKDPSFVFPILMGISMFLQQATSPTMIDKKQKKMMLFIPLIMTFLFVNFPAGLVLYWLFSNLISIFYQKLNK